MTNDHGPAVPSRLVKKRISWPVAAGESLPAPAAVSSSQSRRQASRTPRGRTLSIQQTVNSTSTSPSSRSRRRVCSRASSLRSIPDSEANPRSSRRRPNSISEQQRARLQTIATLERPASYDGANKWNPPPVSRHSSLRLTTRLPEEGDEVREQPHTRTSFAPELHHAASTPSLTRTAPRPHSLPAALSLFYASSSVEGAIMPIMPSFLAPPGEDDPWRMPPLPPSREPTPVGHNPKPRPTLSSYSSLDNIMLYREEKAEWKRASSMFDQGPAATNSVGQFAAEQQPNEHVIFDNSDAKEDSVQMSSLSTTPMSKSPASSQYHPRFRFRTAELGFTLTIMATQFLAEYLISGFALLLPRLMNGPDAIVSGSTGAFWPGVLLSLVLSAMLLPFARASDMYGGYPLFMFGVFWLCIWTLIPGFCYTNVVLLDVSRAMQGMAIAAFTPSTFAMIGSIYTEGPRKNLVMGLYASCAPLGFAGGFLIAGTLPDHMIAWYFWTAAILSCAVLLAAYLSVPHDRTDRCALDLNMDWLGAILITAGFLLLAYGLSVFPHVNRDDASEGLGFASPTVLGPFISGLGCLAAAVWVEGWYAKSPLLPFDFFKPKGVVQFSLASLCFYAAYGVWLYSSAEIFQSPTGTTTSRDGRHGVDLALWYVPMAVGGLVLCIVGGSVMHIVPIMVLLLLSGLAWVACLVLLGTAPFPLHYWAFVFTSTICATLGIDLTYTISIVFLSAVQPLKYQGLAGAVSSILVNLGMSFSLSISEIVSSQAKDGLGSGASSDERTNWGYRAALIYGAASAGVGLLICVFFVRISSDVARAPSQRRTGEEAQRNDVHGSTCALRSSPSSEAPTEAATRGRTTRSVTPSQQSIV